MTTPAIVLKSQFVMPSSKQYSAYINYINRDEAKTNVNLQINNEKDGEPFAIFYSYMDYMGDEEKQGALFTMDQDILTSQQKQLLQSQFQQAEKNGSPMWQDVISFDNRWLIKQSLLDEKTGKLDETKIKKTVREAVRVMLRTEKMEDTAVWSAAIHYNTDNIHIHIATVEPIPTRPVKRVLNKETQRWENQRRAKRKQGTLDKMKSKVVNLLVDRTEERNQITNLIRGSVQLKKEKGIDVSTFRKTKKLFKKAIQQLPSDTRQWQYGYQTINNARPYIDEIVDIYLNKYYKKEMKELNRLLDDEVLTMKEMYGEGSNYEQYKQTKLDDLKKRMGNAVLTEMRAYHREKDTANMYKKANEPFSTWSSNKNLNYAIMNLNYRMRKTYQDYQKERNLAEFDRMLDGYER